MSAPVDEGGGTASWRDLREPIEAALARLPGPLADETARERLRAVAGRLPRALVTGPLGLEIRLAGPTAVDLFAAAVPGQESFAALVACLRRDGWADDGRATDLALVLDCWQHREGPLPQVARYLLVEADAPSTAQRAVSVPSIFLAPRGANDRDEHGRPPNAFQRHVEATTIAAAELSGSWPDPATAAALANAVDALPPEGEIFAVGAMLSRSAGSSMRVAVRRLDPDQLHALLVAVGRPRQAEALAAHARQTVADRVVVAFEVGPGAEQRVGLELSPDHDWKRARTDGWPALMDEVAALGVAEPVRAEAGLGLVDSAGATRWGLAHVKIAADDSGLLPVSKLYVGLLHPEARTDAADVPPMAPP